MIKIIVNLCLWEFNLAINANLANDNVTLYLQEHVYITNMAPAGFEIMNKKYNLFIVLPVDYYSVLIDYVRMGCYPIVSTTGFYKIGFWFLVLISVYGLIFHFKYSHSF